VEGEYRTCRQCGNEFYADQPWKRVCFDCWKESKKQSGQWRGGTSQGWPGQDHHEMLALKAKIASLEWQLLAAQASSIPPDMLRRIIQLCHPDKHNNSAAATEATQWLLKQRQ
jgi:hypothetical protein